MFFSKKPEQLLEIGTRGIGGFTKHKVGEWERLTHTYVIGKTGKGKSKLLEHILFQDVIQGRGCGVLDPHSDLADDLLTYLQDNPELAESHWERVVYFDPSRTDYLIPFNVLQSNFDPYETAQNIVEAFRRTWPKALDEAPRFANIATASALTLIANGLTLVEMPRLLADRDFREELLQNVEDEQLISFWKDRYEKWGREGPLMIESILNKVTAFTLNPQLRIILGAKNNGLDFREIMDEGKVLIVNLGRCDAETRRLIGSLIVTGIEQAARSRRNVRTGRKPFYFCIDEFQDFCSNDGAAQTLAQILSECRKFGLHLTLAHQTLSQISKRMEGALGNIQLKIIFGVSRQDAEILSKHLFQAHGESVKHKVKSSQQQERSHPVFFSLHEAWERYTQSLQNLPSRCAFVKMRSSREVVQIKTIPVKHEDSRESVLDKLKAKLLKNVGQRVEEIKTEISERVKLYTNDQHEQPITFKEASAKT